VPARFGRGRQIPDRIDAGVPRDQPTGLDASFDLPARQPHIDELSVRDVAVLPRR
jgi:hypothetical protein